MDINKIELPPYVIASLYRNSLIEPLQDSPENNETPDTLHALGNNNKHILILVIHPAHPFLPSNEKDFLEGVLKACKLEMDDTSIINLSHHTGSTYKELNKKFKPKTVLLFGADPSLISLPVNFPHFQPQAFTSITYLFAPSLHDLENDKLLKSKLWVCLKRIFGV